MANEAKFWILANAAAKKLGWFPEVIFSQWTWETSHFTSNNLIQNNNIAGQTWYAGCGHDKGTARPAKEGGYYIKYVDAAQGYVEFIKKNIGRYGNVAKQKTIEDQFKQIAADGWAADPHYANNLIAIHQYNQKHGFYKLPRVAAQPVKPVAKPVIKPVTPKPSYHTIGKGETLSGIAMTNKTTIAALKKLNNIKDPNKIAAGAKIRIK